MNYLNDELYYINLHDLFTIEECLDWEKRFLERPLSEYDGKKITSKQALPLKQSMANLMLYFVKGERYRKKAERIREWMEKDRVKQNKLDNTPEPRNIYCVECGEPMECTFKDLHDYTNEPLRVLFFFDCKPCKKRRAVYDNGEEFISKPELCPKCSSELKTTYKRKGKVITTTRKCISCKYVETEIDDLSKKDTTWEKKQEKDRQLLIKYRVKYCLSEKDGDEYVRHTDQMKALMDSFKEQEKKEADPAFQKAKKLKKLSIVELEKTLTETLEKERYIKLSLDKPEMGKFVIVPFTVQDADSSRKEYDSTTKLRKLIKKTLEDTNWRIMTEGASYRLGYVYGRLKGYEREEDLMEIVRKKRNEDESGFITGSDGEKIKL